MCGRYSLALRPSQVRAHLVDESHMPVYDAPEDEEDDAPRQSYNFAPGYRGLVYRAETPDTGAGPPPTQGVDKLGDIAVSASGVQVAPTEVRYKLQTMRWGLIPFYTKRNPDYGSLMKTINCRDDSLIENRGMWTTMKQKKRCIVIAQGFYEWLNKGKQKVPHYIKRKDGQLMCAAALWDCVQYEGSEEKLYTYTIITTSSNKQLNFLHDRMPVILDNGSDDLRTWLDPSRSSWSEELQGLLQPFKGELEVYSVSQEVGKVGNNSPSFIIPVASSENKSNIANFFVKGESKASSKNAKSADIKKETEEMQVKNEPGEDRETIDHNGTEDNAPLPIPKESGKGIKRELEDVGVEDPPSKLSKTSGSPIKSTATANLTTKTKSAKSNAKASPKKALAKGKGTQKITSFFGK